MKNETTRISVTLDRSDLDQVERRRKALKQRQGVNLSLSAAVASLVRSGLSKPKTD